MPTSALFDLPLRRARVLGEAGGPLSSDASQPQPPTVVDAAAPLGHGSPSPRRPQPTTVVVASAPPAATVPAAAEGLGPFVAYRTANLAVAPQQQPQQKTAKDCSGWQQCLHDDGVSDRAGRLLGASAAHSPTHSQ